MHEPLTTHVNTVAQKAGGLLRHRSSLWILGLISFLESALPLPILTDPFLVAHILARREAVWYSVGVTVITSVIGGVCAYILAAAFFATIVSPFLSGDTAVRFYELTNQFQENTALLTLVGALTPVPYTLVALAVGFVQGNIMVFILVSLFGRTVRYAVVGWITYHIGPHALVVAQRRLLLTTVATLVALAVYVWLKH